jgi:flagellar basal body-associated protein FliL
LAKGPGGQLLRAAVALEGYDTMDMAQIKDDLIRVRDVIYRLLRDRPADELGGDRMQNLLGTQIRTELNQSLGGQKVRRVHLTQFIISG